MASPISLPAKRDASASDFVGMFKRTGIFAIDVPAGPRRCLRRHGLVCLFNIWPERTETNHSGLDSLENPAQNRKK
jgi:hypothetical protein